MESFSSGTNTSCCKEYVDCPDYFYLDVNKYSLCPRECMTCTSDSCLTCYNKKELSKYSFNEQAIIQRIKYNISEHKENFWEDESHQ
jgi:hypothetical protein